MFQNKSIKEVQDELGSSNAGLSLDEVNLRKEKYGLNELKGKKKKSIFLMFLSELNDPMIYILIVAAIISLTVSLIEIFKNGDTGNTDWIDTIIIMVVVLFNAIIGTVQEAKANKAVEALKKMSSPYSLVRRDGKVKEVKANELVPGDIVLIEEGSIVPADLRLIESVNLKIDESSLTGESVPVTKDASQVLDEATPIGDRVNLAYSSSIVSYGRGEGIVIGTGMNTEIGNIASMLDDNEVELTPLQKKLNKLSKLLGYVTIGIVIVMLIVGLAYDGFAVNALLENFLLAISLAVAAIPEGLVAVVTIVLSLGVERMSKVNTVVRKLPSVETLGSVDVICSDKTGTLTQNKMTVIKSYVDFKLEDGDKNVTDAKKFLASGLSLCSNASIEGGRYGDPTEIALVQYAQDIYLPKSKLEEKYKRIDEYPFDSVRKMMSTAHVDKDGKNITFTKGAIDSLLKNTTKILVEGKVRDITEDDLRRINKACETMSSEALRILGLCYKEENNLDEKGLTFVGLVGMKDPIREECIPAIKKLTAAHIRTIMITGDHVDTAFAIGKELGLVTEKNQCMTGAEIDALTPEELQEKVMTTSIFARVSPDNKVSIVKALKARGLTVAMTGDGVNDAPSLKAADIGIAMGITGTDVAKEAADMILTDDNFASIEKAVEEGRNIYANLRKTIIFLLSSNMAEVLVLFLATVLGFPAPLISIHLLWINLITDSLPAIALGVDKNNNKALMHEKPRKASESLFAGESKYNLIGYAIVLTVVTLFGFLYFPVIDGSIGLFDIQGIINYFEASEHALREAQSCAFTILGLSELFLMVGFSDTDRSFIHIFKDRNWMLFLSVGLGLLLQVLVTEVPGITTVFKTVQLEAKDWGIIAAASLSPLIIHEIVALIKFIVRKSKEKKELQNA